MSHAVSDAVMDLRVCPDSLHFRLGVQFRIPDQAPPSLESLLPARYLRIQVASPPPRRIDGSRWQDGLRVRDGTKNGREFDADDPTWKKSGVFPLEGISPLDQPPPDTLVLDRWLAVPARTANGGAHDHLPPGGSEPKQRLHLRALSGAGR